MAFFVISKFALDKIKNYKIYWEKEPLSYFLKKKNYLHSSMMGFGKA